MTVRPMIVWLFGCQFFIPYPVTARLFNDVFPERPVSPTSVSSIVQTCPLKPMNFKFLVLMLVNPINQCAQWLPL